MKEQKDRYEIFLKVCETGSFSKAAEALNYTQSGISQMMAGGRTGCAAFCPG
jgi:DNA-binding transcriptional LysR family regulator